MAVPIGVDDAVIGIAVAVLVDAVPARFGQRGRTRVDGGILVVAVVSAGARRVVPVTVRVQQVTAVAVLVDPVVGLLGRTRVDVVVSVVAVLTAGRRCVVAVAVDVQEILTVAVLIDPVIGLFGRTWEERWVRVVAVAVDLREPVPIVVVAVGVVVCDPAAVLVHPVVGLGGAGVDPRVDVAAVRPAVAEGVVAVAVLVVVRPPIAILIDAVVPDLLVQALGDGRLLLRSTALEDDGQDRGADEGPRPAARPRRDAPSDVTAAAAHGGGSQHSLQDTRPPHPVYGSVQAS